MKDLRQKYGDWALITGASAGIGYAFAGYLAKKGMNLILVARRRERLFSLSADLENKYNIQAVPVVLDLTADNFLDELKPVTENREIGLLINNAGYGSAGRFAEGDLDRYTDMIRLNCLAPVRLTHYIVQGMIQRRKGAVIFLGSVTGHYGSPFFSTYSASKAFNIQFGQSLWYELNKFNIDVLVVSPGSTETEFHDLAGFSRALIVLSPEKVVRKTMRVLGRRIEIIIGPENKLLVFFSRLFPGKLILRIKGFAVKYMIRNK
ncbi:SDR family oxidoreductase [candidate division KSB1 bacterium]|nr:SDR family oxidoreductase [candidate division KSB1 bacterium]